VHISRATYELLGDEFRFAPRGIIPIKGKGEMETWFLEGRV
jgi:class 3 adenylate cyclase